MQTAWLSWSSGKDCSWALHVLRRQANVQVTGLLTTFNQAANQVAVHAVRRSLVEEQARLAELPLHAFNLPYPCSNEQYEEIMAAACRKALAEGVECIAFGDLFLQDVRDYREKQLQPSGLKPLFPLWGIPTVNLAEEMIKSGLRARITCVDPRQLSPQFAGKDWHQVSPSLPPEVDICGERGEFHTFAYAGPMFAHPMHIETGETVERDGFVFTDVVGPTVRTASLEDVPALCSLAAELGYPISERDARTRLAACLNDPSRSIQVAELDNQVVGWADLAIANHFVSGKYGELAGLVVKSGLRGKGIGAYLLARSEAWMKAQGLGSCLVRSRETRSDAHRFYLREGYKLQKKSAVFTKLL